MTSSTTSLFPGLNHFISLAKASEMTARYRAEKENILVPELQGKDILLICETFNREAFDGLLAQPGCAGLRTYFGMDADLKVRVIVVGVNAQNEDMLPATLQEPLMTGTEGGEIVEQGQPCPIYCPPPSQLNS